MWRIHVLGVVEWSRVPLQFRCNFAGVAGKAGGPNCHNIKLLENLLALQMAVSSFVAQDLLTYSTDLFEIRDPPIP